MDEIEGALKLNESIFKKVYGFRKPTPEDKLIVVYCRSGMRSNNAGKLFTQMNFAK